MLFATGQTKISCCPEHAWGFITAKANCDKQGFYGDADDEDGGEGERVSEQRGDDG